MTSLHSIVQYLNEYLKVQEIPDYPSTINGLQFEGKEQVGKVGLAVDLCIHSVKEAIKRGADLLVVHHGLAWASPRPVKGIFKELLRLILDADLSVYGVHLPLDCHEEVGNNHVLARALGLEVEGKFAKFQGVEIGVIARGKLTIKTLWERLEAFLKIPPIKVIPFGPPVIERIGIVSGGGGDAITEALDLRLDALLTGEAKHHHYFAAEEGKIHLILAGHYATEQVGLWALGEHIKKKFNLDVFFISHPTGM